MEHAETCRNMHKNAETCSRGLIRTRGGGEGGTPRGGARLPLDLATAAGALESAVGQI